MTTTNNTLGLYLHVPFCRHKCRYCDFLSFACDKEQILHEYAEALLREMDIQSEEYRYKIVDSIFIGGGTPSLLSVEDTQRIMDALQDNFYIAKDTEITIESNPATLDEYKLESYLDMGINRLSIGVQSFENSVLQILGRIHDKNEAFQAIQMAKKVGFENINIDIMFGIPGQSMKMWKDTVRQCIFQEPQHISLYSLQVEEGTEMYKLIYDTEALQLPDEETDRKMYHEALQMLRAAGFNQYEISNAAMPGFESRHNRKYWSYEEYAGLGLGASSFTGGKRFRNYSKMMDYLKAIKEHRLPVDENSFENYTLRDEMGIYVFTGLRKAEGVNLLDFYDTFQMDLFDIYDPEIIKKYKGYIELYRDQLYLTPQGMDISNKIMAEFV